MGLAILQQLFAKPSNAEIDQAFRTLQDPTATIFQQSQAWGIIKKAGMKSRCTTNVGNNGGQCLSHRGHRPVGKGDPSSMASK